MQTGKRPVDGASTVEPSPGGRPPAVRRRVFYIGLILFMSLMAVGAFWPYYFGPMLHRSWAPPWSRADDRPGAVAVRAIRVGWLIHMHTAIALGWLALLLGQAVLAARGKIKLHRKIGAYGNVYGGLVLVTGTIVAFAAPALNVGSGRWSLDRGASNLLIFLGDMVLFGSFFAASVIYRRRPEIHKRMILVATLALIFPAVLRLPIPSPPHWIFVLVYLSPLVAGMIHDRITKGRVHPAYVIGAVTLLVFMARTVVNGSETWLRIARPIVTSIL